MIIVSSTLDKDKNNSEGLSVRIRFLTLSPTSKYPARSMTRVYNGSVNSVTKMCEESIDMM
jgi:hypothetical protein